MLHGAVRELIVAVLVPDYLEIKVRAVHAGLEMRQASSVRQGFCCVMERLVEWCCEFVCFDAGIMILGQSGRSRWVIAFLPYEVLEHWHVGS